MAASASPPPGRPARPREDAEEDERCAGVDACVTSVEFGGGDDFGALVARSSASLAVSSARCGGLGLRVAEARPGGRLVWSKRSRDAGVGAEAHRVLALSGASRLTGAFLFSPCSASKRLRLDERDEGTEEAGDGQEGARREAGRADAGGDEGASARRSSAVRGRGGSKYRSGSVADASDGTEEPLRGAEVHSRSPSPQGERSLSPSRSPRRERSLSPSRSPRRERSLSPSRSPRRERSLSPSRSPRRERSLSPSRSRSPRRGRSVSTSPSRSPRRGRSFSRSPSLSRSPRRRASCSSRSRSRSPPRRGSSTSPSRSPPGGRRSPSRSPPPPSSSSAPAAAAPAAAAAAPSSSSPVPWALASTSTRSGGAYVPPFRLARQLREAAARDEAPDGPGRQRLSWESLKKGINGVVNKVSRGNIRHVLAEAFSENLVRGRGLFCRAVLRAAAASPQLAPVLAALVAVINAKLPEIGELLLTRCLAQFARAFRRNDASAASAALLLLAHLCNQRVAHEVLALELVVSLLESPTDDSLALVCAFVTQCGALLDECAPAALSSVFDRLRAALREGDVGPRAEVLVEQLFALRKAGFEASRGPPVEQALDLLEDEDRITHEASLGDALEPHPELDVFRLDPDYLAHEEEWRAIKHEILGDDEEEDDEDESGDESEEEDDEDESGEEIGEGSFEKGEKADKGRSGSSAPLRAGGAPFDATSTSSVARQLQLQQQPQHKQQRIEDLTGTDLVSLRRTIYLAMMSSLDYEEAGHKLLRLGIPPGAEGELAAMVVEACGQEKTFGRFHSLLAERFCKLRREYRSAFEDQFVRQYASAHRLETGRLRNVAKLFAHLVATNAVSWEVLRAVELTEETTTSSSRIFAKILFQDVAEALGVKALRKRLEDPEDKEWYEGLFPEDSVKHLRFAINFFTSIGLGALTERARARLKELPKILEDRKRAQEEEEERQARKKKEEEEEEEEERRDAGRGRTRAKEERSRLRSRSRSYDDSSSRSSSRSRSYDDSSSRSSSRSRSYDDSSSRSSSRSRSYDDSSSRSRSRSRSYDDSSSRSRSRSYDDSRSPPRGRSPGSPRAERKWGRESRRGSRSESPRGRSTTPRRSREDSRSLSPAPPRSARRTRADSRSLSPAPPRSARRTRADSRSLSPAPPRSARRTRADSRSLSPAPPRSARRTRADSRSLSPAPPRSARRTRADSRSPSPYSARPSRR